MEKSHDKEACFKNNDSQAFFCFVSLFSQLTLKTLGTFSFGEGSPKE